MPEYGAVHPDPMPVEAMVPQYSSKRLLWNGILFSNAFAWAEGTLTAILALSAVLVDKDLYAESGVLLYACFSVGTLIAPTVVHYLGLKPSLVAGLLGFSMFAASFVHPTAYVMKPAACINGLCGSFLWTAQGVYFTNNAYLHTKSTLRESAEQGEHVNPRVQFKHSVGLMSGIFAGVFPFALAACKLVAALILDVNKDDGTLIVYILYTTIAVLATAAMCFVLPLKNLKAAANMAPRRRLSRLMPSDVIPPPPPAASPDAVVGSDDGAPRASRASRNSMLFTRSEGCTATAGEAPALGSTPHGDDPPADTVVVETPAVPPAPTEPQQPTGEEDGELKGWPFLRQNLLSTFSLLIEWKMLLMIPTNIVFGLTAGYFPVLITPMIHKHHNKGVAGLMYAMSGGVAFLLAFPYGYVSNRFTYGRAIVMIWGAMSYAGIFTFLALNEANSIESFLLIFTLYGSGNTVWQGTCMAVFADYWGKDPAPAFANLKLHSGVATTLAYACFPKTSLTSAEIAKIILVCDAVAIVLYLATVILAPPEAMKRYPTRSSGAAILSWIMDRKSTPAPARESSTSAVAAALSASAPARVPREQGDGSSDSDLEGSRSLLLMRSYMAPL
eukprot:Rhum_TRINITY_DN2744_c0_g1::Rhum_TRINITY_DN2744_c0_g1_i1::g.8073::m.8073